jgi:drug/metabolite transporter (DMT)-like permease
MTTERSSPTLIYAAFAAIYLIWGTSFAATKFMVHDLPPLFAGGVRFILAGLLLVGFARLRGAALPEDAREWRHVAVMGLLHVVLSAGVNVLALRHVPSNQSALLNTSSALWIPLLGSLGVRGHPLTARVSVGLVLGATGVVLLMVPKGGLSLSHFGWQLIIIAACFCWALGTLYYRSVRSKTASLMFVGLQMLMGGSVLATTGAAMGDVARWQWTVQGLAGLAFLTIMSSCVAYTSFGYLMRHVTPARLSTYGYVNPAIAAVVGWLLLGERMSGVQIVGTAVILVGVVLVSLPAADAAAPTPVESTG